MLRKNLSTLFRYWPLILLVGCSQQPLEFHGPTMGTSYTVKISSVLNSIPKAELSQHIAAILEQLYTQMTTYSTTSEVSRFSASHSTDWFSVSPDVCKVVAEAQRISRLSYGAFDITVAPIVNLWGFGPAPQRTTPPSTKEIQIALHQIGYEHLYTRCEQPGLPPALRKDQPDIAIDLSAIDQGYAADRVADYLDSLQIENYLVDVGGEMRGRGVNSHGVPWHIGIEQPTIEPGQVERTIQIKDCAIATSGTYRNFFAANGKHYAHIIDPHTGAPITHSLVSVTIIAHSATIADALTTAVLVLGPERGFELVMREKLAALLIVQQGNQFIEKATPNLASYLL